MSKILFVAVFSVLYACGSNESPGAGPVDPVESLDVRSDVDIPKFANYSKSDMEFQLKDNANSLFDYQDPNIIMVDSDDNYSQCVKEWLSESKVNVQGQVLTSDITMDESFISCIRKGASDAWLESTEDGEGRIVTNNQGSGATRNSCSDQNYSVTSVMAGSHYNTRISADESLQRYAGKTLTELKFDKGSVFNTFTASKYVSASSKNKNLSQGIICQDEKFAKFKVKEESTEACSYLKLDEKSFQKSCQKVETARIYDVKSDQMELAEVTEKLNRENYLAVEELEVVLKEGRLFPISGTKKVTLRNWTGTIEFSEGNPKYYFSNGKETISGVFNPSAD